MTDEKLAEIESRAKAATPGPWRTRDEGSRHKGCVAIEEHGRAVETIAVYCGALDGHGATNASHIAGMDPTTTLALVAALREARALLGEARKHVQKTVNDYPNEFTKRASDLLARIDAHLRGES